MYLTFNGKMHYLTAPLTILSMWFAVEFPFFLYPMMQHISINGITSAADELKKMLEATI